MRKNTHSPKSLKQFITDQSGIAAIEFVITFPILIALLFGCIELYGHFNAVRKIGNVTASFADIVAQSRVITEEQLIALNPLANSLMQPFDGSTIAYTISSIRQGDGEDKPKLVWEYSHSSGGKDSTTADGNIACKEYKGAGGKKFPPNQDVIYVNVQYTYDSLFKNYIGGPTDYADEMISVPRASGTVRLVDKNGSTLSKCY